MFSALKGDALTKDSLVRAEAAAHPEATGDAALHENAWG
jgi:hypothetical protein